MHTVLSTTALILALGLPTPTPAQPMCSVTERAATLVTDHAGGPGSEGMPHFLAARGQSDVLASNLIGHDVHARRTLDRTRASSGQTVKNADRMNVEATMSRADLDDMDNIGRITEIVLSKDGRIRALVIGVGGFLGTGEQDVAVTMDRVTFASHAEDRSQIYIVVNTRADTLKDAPAYDRTAAVPDSARGNDETRINRSKRTDFAKGRNEARADRKAFAAPDMVRHGYDRIELAEVPTRMLMGEPVHDVNDNDVGTVTEMIIDEAGAITNVIIDFGGFLGIGRSRTALSHDELTILTSEGFADVRVYVDATREQIQDLPRYLVAN